MNNYSIHHPESLVTIAIEAVHHLAEQANLPIATGFVNHEYKKGDKL